MNRTPLPFHVELGSGLEPIERHGWDMLENPNPGDIAQATQEQLDHASLYRQCFATTAGRYVLEDLVRTFLEARIVRPDDTSFAAGIRQGQADVPARIIAMIRFANTGGGIPTGPNAQPIED